MPTARKLLAGLALAFTAISCSQDQQSPTAPTDQPTAAPTARKTGTAVLSGTLAQTQTYTSTATGTLPVGTVVTIAKVQITHFSYDAGQLYVDGGFFDENGALITAFSHAPATLTSSGGPTQPTCPILTLDIGAIHLDLLGLVVDLAPVHLDITAQSGSGNLLGNLLCALVNLLNGGGLALQIQSLLTQINALLTALLAIL